MLHHLDIPDDTYATIIALAKERGQSPEVLVAQLLQKAFEQHG